MPFVFRPPPSLLKFAEPGDPDWKTVHRIAEKAETPLAEKIVAAFESAQRINEAALTLDITVHGAEGQIDWAGLREKLSVALADAIRSVATETAMTLLPRFRQTVEPSFTFADPMDQTFESMSLVLRFYAAEDYLKANLPTLITNVTTETQAVIRDVILNGFQNGVPPRDMARQIRSMVGVTRPQGITLNRLIKGWVDAGLARPQLDANVRRTVAKMIRYRALNIARTETLRASNAGQQALWNSAADAGLLQREVTKREWIATPSERTCEQCMALDGVKVGMDELFHGGSYGDVRTPPLHPSCRCAMGIAIEVPEKPPVPQVQPLAVGQAAPITPLTDQSLLPEGNINLPAPIRADGDGARPADFTKLTPGGVADSVNAFTNNGDQYIRSILRGESAGGMQERASQWASTLLDHLERRGTKSGNLFRGIKINEGKVADVLGMSPGTAIDMNLSSWSVTLGNARKYAAAGIESGERQVIFHVEGAKGIQAAKFSGFQEEREWITNGRFIFKSATLDAQGRIIVELTQERVWAFPKGTPAPVALPPSPLAYKPITNIQQFGQAPGERAGVSVTYTGTIEGQKVFIKPDAGLYKQQVRAGVPIGSESKREQAAALLNKELKLVDMPDMAYRDVTAVVPPKWTSSRGGPLGPSLVIEWRTGEAFVGYHGVLPSDIRSAALFDAIIGNLDRHVGNSLISGASSTVGMSVKRLVAIDHGLSFPKGLPATARSGYQGNYDLLVVRQGLVGSTGGVLTASERSLLQGIRQDEPKLRGQLEPLVGKNAVDNMFARVDYMLAQGRVMTRFDFEQNWLDWMVPE